MVLVDPDGLDSTSRDNLELERQPPAGSGAELLGELLARGAKATSDVRKGLVAARRDEVERYVEAADHSAIAQILGGIDNFTYALGTGVLLGPGAAYDAVQEIHASYGEGGVDRVLLDAAMAPVESVRQAKAAFESGDYGGFVEHTGNYFLQTFGLLEAGRSLIALEGVGGSSGPRSGTPALVAGDALAISGGGAISMSPSAAVAGTVGGPAGGIAGLVFSMSMGGGSGGGGASGGSVGQQISQGHAFQKHVVNKGEYKGLGISTRPQFAQHIDDVMNNATGKNVRALAGGRTAYWDDASGTVVVHNPAAADAGTAFRPAKGRKYFEGLK